MKNESDQKPQNTPRRDAESRRVCPVCGGTLVEIRQKLHCSRCGAICETCCEGGRG